MFKSPCRVCKCWAIKGYHFVPVDTGGPTTCMSSSTVRKEDCSPSDNLEYLEWKYERSLKI